MLKFPFKKPIKTFTTHTSNKLIKVILPTWYSQVELGDYSYMNDQADIQSFRTPQIVKIGKYCSVGNCKFIIDGDHNIKFASTYPFNEFGYSKNAPENKNIKHAPIICNDVWIGDGAIIYGGVTINNGAVIGGNSVITKDVPAYAVTVGNPGKIVKYRFDKRTINRLLKVKWWDLDHDFICTELAPIMNNVEDFLLLIEKNKHL